MQTAVLAPKATSVRPKVENLADLPATLDNTEGFPELLAAIRAGKSGAIGGAWGSSSSLAVAALAQHMPPVTLVVLAHPSHAEPWAADLASLTGHCPAIFWASDEQPDDRPSTDSSSRRLRILRQLQENPPAILLTSIGAILQAVPTPSELAARRVVLQRGQIYPPEDLERWLAEAGYKKFEAIEEPGDFARRGCILDVFSPDAIAPWRIEWFDNEIESIRAFDPLTQRSLGQHTSVQILALGEQTNSGHLADYLPPGSLVVLVEPTEIIDEAKQFLERAASMVGLFGHEACMQELLKLPSVTLTAFPAASSETTCQLRVESVERLSGNISKLREELDGIAVHENVFIACPTEAECHRLGEVLAAGKLAESHRLKLVKGTVRAGYRLVNLGYIILGSHELFHRESAVTVTRDADSESDGLPRRRVESRAIDSFLDLSEGDFVVHLTHGIARYRGMKMLPRTREAGEVAAPLEEHLTLEFREGVKLYVPASKIDLVQKYVGSTNSEPELSKIGGTSWQKKKAKVAEAVIDLATEMLDLQARRAAQAGFAFPPDSAWQKEFEAAFPYRETPDQLTSLAEIRADMESLRPMDRLVCGDVGYGKTELAIRATFKAIDAGKQVAILVPTTVLAEQHYRNFCERFAEYPFVVEGLSRFRTTKEIRDVIKRLKTGEVDLVIGTHRLLSPDVVFKDLGLVVIDEEQRFGVEHKEKLKRLRAMVDILTLTATPIPRTLHLSLLGIRDISNLETPPADRLPIETRICRFDKHIIRNAVLRELNRDGQVYFVHNRVNDIQQIAEKLRQIVPEAKLVIAHGQMSGDELESAMLRFIRREADILLATTIIESGLDIPNANTMFINQADNYGLADLHQLRGRVGRQKNRAYAYLLLDPGKSVSDTAAKRLKAIEEYRELGAGFKIAMRDLEIRGAGNILGTQQSGHIAAVGYELYCQLLENAVRRLKKMPLREPLEVSVDLPWPAYLPRDYVTSQKARIEVYRRLARVRDLSSLVDLRAEMRDRFGPLPEPAEWLLRTAEVRIRAADWQIASIHRDDKGLLLNYRDEPTAEVLSTLSNGRLRVVDEKNLFAHLNPEHEVPERLFEQLQKWLPERPKPLAAAVEPSNRP